MYSKEYIEELVKDLKRNKSIIEDKNMCIKSLNKINFEMKCKLSDEKLKVESRQKEIEYLTQKNKILETKIKNLTNKNKHKINSKYNHVLSKKDKYDEKREENDIVEKMSLKTYVKKLHDFLFKISSCINLDKDIINELIMLEKINTEELCDAITLKNDEI
ncbi:hypothetical protein EHP00_171 [Ecytonucleospora hepatopenaei]|uniref:Uncharacterized protein n=1 Tax=Ecytonucleospora hepatopenaei TaxID=646526 RepID=A0A1W0E6I2_9MICR|nr:hypothetical protein EHP00_171 [Ecytonucleospora hepatopenaei]